MCCLFDRFQDVVGEPLPHRRSIKFPNTQDQLFTTAHNKKLSKRFARHEVPIHPIHAVRDGTIFTTSYDKQFSLTRSATVKNWRCVRAALGFSVTRGWFPWLADVMP